LNERRIVTLGMTLLLGLVITCPLLFADEASAEVEPYAISVVVTDMDGNETGGNLSWDRAGSPCAWDNQAGILKKEIQAEHLLKVTNTGANPWGAFWVNLTSSDVGLDLVTPGTWYVDYGSLDDLTNTTTMAYSVPEGTEILHGIVDTLILDDFGEQDMPPGLVKNIAKQERNSGNSIDVTKHINPRNPKANKSPVAWNYTLTPGDSMFVHFILMVDHLPDAHNYSIGWELQAFDDYGSLIETRPTKATSSDTETGTTTLEIGVEMDITLTYTGTHDTEVYFTEIVGGPTDVFSVNDLRVWNTGNTNIKFLWLDVGSTQVWLEDTTHDGVGDTPTSYTLNGNTLVYHYSIWYDLNPWNRVATFSTTWIPGLFNDFEFKLVNAVLPQGDYFAGVDIYAESAAGDVSATKTAVLEYQPYTGAFDVSLTYTSGSGLEFPVGVAPGDVDVSTTNGGRITNSALSDFTMTDMAFLFGPLSLDTNLIPFADNAVLTLDDGVTTYDYALVSFVIGTETFGRAVITLDGSGDPAAVAPGDELLFSVSIDLIPSVSPGVYSGSFAVECAANPVQVLYGTYSLGEDVGSAFEITPWIVPSTGVSVGDTVSTGALVEWERGTIPWAFMLFTMKDEDGGLVWSRQFNITDEIVEAELGDLLETNMSTDIDAGTWTPTEEGNYTMLVQQGYWDGSEVVPVGEPQEIHLVVSVEEDAASITASFSSLVSDFVSTPFGAIFSLLLLVVIGYIGYVEYKKREAGA